MDQSVGNLLRSLNGGLYRSIVNLLVSCDARTFCRFVADSWQIGGRLGADSRRLIGRAPAQAT